MNVLSGSFDFMGGAGAKRRPRPAHWLSDWFWSFPVSGVRNSVSDPLNDDEEGYHISSPFQYVKTLMLNQIKS